MIEGALKVSTDQVRDVMIPRPQVVFIEKEKSLKISSQGL